MDVTRLAALDDDALDAFRSRDAGIDAVRDDVAGIIERIRADGDEAIRQLSRELDGVDTDSIEVTDRVMALADDAPRDVVDAIETAAANIRAFHERQCPADWRDRFDGRELGRRFSPIGSVGVYVPGGRATYPSTALMGVIPARTAGVDEVAVTTPPAEELSPVTCAAIAAAGADRVYAIGGAQAIAALAYGTDTVDPVEKVVGPGNRWVTAAKAAVRGAVAIDFLAGPSEVLVLADSTATPRYVAAELVAQAEHDPDASVVAVTDDPGVAADVAAAVERQATETPRDDVVRAALDNPHSGILVADTMTAAAEFAEAYAPEHLVIDAADDEALLDRVPSAGSVFLGPYTPVAAGDYASGTNHVLPTGGAARVVGGLSVETFMRATTVQRLDRDALEGIADTITTLAAAEGFDAHAASVRYRLDD